MMNRHMKRRMRALGIAAVMLAMSATLATAAGPITVDQVVATYEAKLYTRVEVKVGLTQIKVEAVRDGMKVETIYDIATGDILKSEQEAVEAGDDVSPGVEIRRRYKDFLEVDEDEDDNDDDDDDDDDDDSQDEDEDANDHEDDDNGASGSDS